MTIDYCESKLFLTKSDNLNKLIKTQKSNTKSSFRFK